MEEKVWNSSLKLSHLRSLLNNKQSTICNTLVKKKEFTSSRFKKKTKKKVMKKKTRFVLGKVSVHKSKYINKICRNAMIGRFSPRTIQKNEENEYFFHGLAKS